MGYELAVGQEVAEPVTQPCELRLESVACS